MPVIGPELLYKNFVEFFNLGKLYDLVQLYSSAAVLSTEPGATCYGRAQINDALKSWLAMGGTMYLATRFQMQSGDAALLSAEWRFVYGPTESPSILTGVSAEVCRRGTHDEWLFICSNWHAQLTSMEAIGTPLIHPGTSNTWA